MPRASRAEHALQSVRGGDDSCRAPMNPEVSSSASDRDAERRGPDRRRQPTPRVSRYSLWGGRRRGMRRNEEREGTFVDVYGTRLFGLVAWIALMNVGDSFFTLVHLQAGGVELNPVADLLLTTGRWSFVLTKSILIGLALVVLAVHKNFHLARIGLWTAAGTYTVLVAYHLLLFRAE